MTNSQRRAPALWRILIAALALLPSPANSHTGASVQCLRSVNQRIYQAHADVLAGFNGTILLFDVALGRNLGDCILWLGAKRVVRAFRRNPDLVCSYRQGRHPQFPVCPGPKRVAMMSRRKPVLLLWHPGGNFGDLWGPVQQYRLGYLRRLDSELARMGDISYGVTAVCLPQSVFYVRPAVAASEAATLRGFLHVRFVLLHRSVQSARGFAQLLANSSSSSRDSKASSSSSSSSKSSIDSSSGSDRTLLAVSPDVAFAIGPQWSVWRPTVDVYFLLRDDNEALQNYSATHDQIRRFFARPENGGVTYAVGDWRMFRSQGRIGVYVDHADVRLQEAIHTVSQGRVVITNRLHAVITAALLRRPCMWFDPVHFTAYRKLEGTVGTAFNSSPYCTEANMLSFQSRTKETAAEPSDAMHHVTYERQLQMQYERGGQLLEASMARAVAYLRANKAQMRE